MLENNNYSSTTLSNENPIITQLIEFGINKIYSKRIFSYIQPQNIDEVLDYLSYNDGIIQHEFVQDRIKSKNCYICGEEKKIHRGYTEENKIKDKSNLKKEKKNKDIKNQKIKTKKICEICDEAFISNKYNTIINCKHSFCNDCWYDFLSLNINENKLGLIKCLKYGCKEKLSDKFIINLLKSNKKLIKKYKKYKLELEIINNPNKKFCPFPNCNSYLELKDIHIKDVKCGNNHEFCFLCLQKPHGKIKCNENIDSTMINFAQNHFIKKCPNCKIITEKNGGCNHIICSKCNYQWCWLCNEEYSTFHFKEGKCKGLQYFKPNDEYEIKLAFEGNIQLRESQRQEFSSHFSNSSQSSYSINSNNIRFIGGINNERVENVNRVNNIIEIQRELYYEKFSNCKTLIIFIGYILFGHNLISIVISANYLKKINNLEYLCVSIFILFQINYFFIIIYFNVIMLIPYIVSIGFFRFIYQFFYFQFHKITEIIRKLFLILSNACFGGFFILLFIGRYFNIYSKYSKKIFDKIYIATSVILVLLFFPIQLILNIIYITYIALLHYWNFTYILNSNVNEVININFI